MEKSWMVGLLSLCLATNLAQAQENVAGYDVDLPAPATGSLVHDGRLYIAMGQGDIWVFTVEGDTATFEKKLSYGGQALDITEVGGQPWVLLQTLDMQPLSATSNPALISGASSFPMGADDKPEMATSKAALVISVEDSTAIINLGVEDGLEVGTPVQFIHPRPVEIEGIQGINGEALIKEESVGLGFVSVVGAGKSQVSMARGGRTEAGDRVEIQDSADHRPLLPLLSPRRLGGIYEVSMTLRPFLGIGTMGVGSINQFSAQYYGNGPYFAALHLDPFSLGLSRDGNLLGASAVATVGYDNPYFALGLGFGITAANTGITAMGSRINYGYSEAASDSAGGGYSFELINVNRAPTLSQSIRLGARDGFHIELRNTFISAPIEIYEDNSYWDEETDEWVVVDPVKVDEYNEFRWGSTYGKVMIPLSQPTDIFVDVGGGATGYFSVAGGVSTWLRGNGDRGSLGISASAGFGRFAGTPDEDFIDLLGPLVGFGMRSRF